MAPGRSDATTSQRRRYAPRVPPGACCEQPLDAARSLVVRDRDERLLIEVIARAAGATRLVVDDHFENMRRLLRALIERQESHALEQSR